MSLGDAQQVLRQLGLEPGMANIALGSEKLAQGLGIHTLTILASGIAQPATTSTTRRSFSVGT